MDNDEEILISSLFILMFGTYVLRKRISFRWTNREYWVRLINIRRSDQGDFHNLLQEMKQDPYIFPLHENVRMRLLSTGNVETIFNKKKSSCIGT